VRILKLKKPSTEVFTKNPLKLNEVFLLKPEILYLLFLFENALNFSRESSQVCLIVLKEKQPADLHPAFPVLPKVKKE
jgi:hypothetical protein